MGTFTSTGSGGNWTDDSTWAETGQPAADGTDHCIISAGDTVTLTGNTGTGSIKISGTIVGGGHTLTVNRASSNKPFDNDGTIDSGSDLNVTITNTGAQQDDLLLDAMGSSGNINDLTINLANGTTSNKTIGIADATTIDGDLTITSGTLNTSFAGGTAADLTVAGKATVTGTLTLNDSTVDIAQTLQAESAGIITCGNTNLTVGSLVILGTMTLPSASGSCTVDSEGTSSHGTNGFAIDINGTVVHNNGKVNITTANTVIDITGTSGNLYDLEINGLVQVPSGTHTIDNNVTIASGHTFSTNNLSTSLTVHGNVNVSGTFWRTDNSGTVTLGGLTINSGGLYRATNATTIMKGALRNVGGTIT